MLSCGLSTCSTSVTSSSTESSRQRVKRLKADPIAINRNFRTPLAGVLGCWALCLDARGIPNRKELEEAGRNVLSSPVRLTFRRQ